MQSIINIDEILKAKEGFTNTKNRMGCSENWYDPYYAIANTFSEEELRDMSQKELMNLHKLANTIGDALY